MNMSAQSVALTAGSMGSSSQRKASFIAPVHHSASEMGTGSVAYECCQAECDQLYHLIELRLFVQKVLHDAWSHIKRPLAGSDYT